YRDEICCFNDDVQGTAAVCLGCLLAACKAKNERVRDQTLVFAGAGAAGCGIAEAVVATMVSEGLSEQEARSRIFMLARNGLITDDMTGLSETRLRLAQPKARLTEWDIKTDEEPLLSVIEHAKPTVLIGVSGQRGMFSQQVIERMHQHCAQPFVMPLSNPTTNVEATPTEILQWTDGAAMVVTGSPFPPVAINGGTRSISQCNNSYIFPGVGLGVVAARAQHVTDDMLIAAAEALAENSPLATHGQGTLLPAMNNIDRKSTRLNSSHVSISYAVFCLKKNSWRLRTPLRSHIPTPGEVTPCPTTEGTRWCPSSKIPLILTSAIVVQDSAGQTASRVQGR